MAGSYMVWEGATLGELGQFRNGVNFSQDDYGEGIPIINVKQLYGGRFAEVRGLRELRQSAIRNLDAVQLRAGDILFARSSVKASGAGQVAMVGNCPRNTVFSGFVIRFRVEARERAEPSFLNYVLRSPVYRELLTRIGSGTTITNLSQDTLAGIEVNLPPLPEQRAITHILGTLDDKIELNRRMNETLEAMVRALFKSWFVDFDPVRAKADGRDPGLPKSLADLFPNSFEYSELGEIPEGWVARPLYQTARFINGAAFKTKDFCVPEEGLPVVKIAELKDGFSEQTKFSQRTADVDHLIDTGDLLYSWSGSPDTSLDAFVWTKGQGLLNQHIFKVVAPSAAQKRFVYYLLKFLRPTLIEIARNKQTTGLGHVTVADMKRLQVCWPSKAVFAAFDRQAIHIFDRVFNNTLESQNLAALRDTLLPELLSGEFRVKDAKLEIEETA